MSVSRFRVSFFRFLAVLCLGVLYQRQEFGDCFFLWDVSFHAFLPAVERNLAAGRSDITVVSVGHLARSIHYAPHDCNFQPFEMAGGGFDTVDGAFQIVQSAAAPWAADVFGFCELDAGGLQDAVGKFRQAVVCEVLAAASV